jgi:murein L,D-transpeptidase YcbB/YkuD
MPPGPTNPLGRVKFEFPNPYAVYLHDTPKKGLFQRERRDFSHGCVRVERAKELAEILLKDDGNPSSDKLQDYFSSYRQAYIRLTQPIPIIIEYQQVSFNEGNEVVFCGDPYGWFRETAQVKSQDLQG